METEGILKRWGSAGWACGLTGGIDRSEVGRLETPKGSEEPDEVNGIV